MSKLPRGAKLYLLLIYLLGAAAAAFAAVMPVPKADAQGWELGAYLVLAALASSRKIRLMRHRSDEDNVSLSLGYVLTCTALLRFGPAAAVLVSAFGSLSNGLFPLAKRQPTHQLLFNVSTAAVETWVAGLVFLWLNQHSLTLRNPGTYPAVAGFSLVYFLLNTGMVSVILALCTEQKPLAVWRETFVWTAPSYFAGACISTLAILLFSSHIGFVLLLLAPLGWVVFQNYSTRVARTEEQQQHIEEIQLGQEHLAELYLSTIGSLALAIDAKDQYTHQHILRVQRYAVATAKHMGLVGIELKAIEMGALLHDIGKLGVPEYVLLKPGRLTDEEFAKIKEHPQIGADILHPVEFPWPVLPVVRSHHEKWDGTGYPDGLKGEDIPRTARILAVADVYDALTSQRSYRSAWTHARACEVITKDRGTHFDPVIADAFLEVITKVVEEMAREGDGPLIIAETEAKSSLAPAGPAADLLHPASSELWALYEVVQTLSPSLGVRGTLEILSRKLEALLPGTAALFLLREEDCEEDCKEDCEADAVGMSVRAAVGLNREYFTNARTLGPAGTSLQVAASRLPYQGGYDADDLLLTASQSARWTALQTALIVPVVHQGEVLGTINLYHPDREAFSGHDRQILETIAERAAAALYNGLLFDRTRSHAVTDPLTGLHTLRHITQHVGDCCRAGRPFALLCLDLDSFKPVNDSFGHRKGDQVLRDLSLLFQDTVRAGDIVARYGGDQFLVYVHGGGAAEVAALTARIRFAVESYEPGLLHPRLGALYLDISTGAGCFPADGSDFTSLIAAADSHLSREKTERKLGRLAAPDRMHLGAEFGLPRAA